MTDPDRRLARRAGRGERQAVAQLYERYRGRLFGFLVRVSGPRAAEDVFQEVWLRVIRRIGSFDSRRGTFSAWVHTIAANAAIDHRRRQRLRASESLDPAPNGDPSEPSRLERLECTGPAPEMRAMAASLGNALERAIERLDPKRRMAVLLRHHAGMSYREVAEALGVPAGTAKSMVHRGVLELRGALEGWSDARS